jgi:pyrroloquinoline quinone (PQQ) biosynthesis protein C
MKATMTNNTLPFRQELRAMQQQHPLFQTTHPFWNDCFRGRLSVDDLRCWGLDVYPMIRRFANFYVNVAAKCDSERTLTFLAETIFEETGSGVEAESHPTLFRNFLKALGISDDDISENCITEAGGACAKFCHDLTRTGTFLEGIALVGVGIERTLPGFFQMLAQTFQRRYSMDESAVKFFLIHTVADVKHSQIASRIVAELAETPNARKQIRELLFHFWDLQKRQLDELHQLARENRMVTQTLRPA